MAHLSAVELKEFLRAHNVTFDERRFEQKRGIYNKQYNHIEARRLREAGEGPAARRRRMNRSATPTDLVPSSSLAVSPPAPHFAASRVRSPSNENVPVASSTRQLGPVQSTRATRQQHQVHSVQPARQRDYAEFSDSDSDLPRVSTVKTTSVTSEDSFRTWLTPGRATSTPIRGAPDDALSLQNSARYRPFAPPATKSGGKRVKGGVITLVVVILILIAFTGFQQLSSIQTRTMESLDQEARIVTKDPRDNMLVCKKTTSDVCFAYEEVIAATRLLDEIKEAVSLTAVNHFCAQDPKDTGVYLPLGNLKTHLLQKREFAGNTLPLYTERLLKVAVTLFIYNPRWDLLPVTVEGKPAKEFETVTKFEAINVNLPFSCTCWWYLHRAVECTLAVLFIYMFAVVGWKFYNWRQEQRAVHDQEVCSLVKEILDVLRAQYDDSKTRSDVLQYVPVSHVRDRLIAPEERRALQGLWQEAVDYVRSNESRVVSEVRFLQGEEYAVWRWTDPIVANPIARLRTGATTTSKVHVRASVEQSSLSSEPRRQWNGTAFEDDHSRRSPPAEGPTCCLKVRGMFQVELESGPNWHVEIKDSVMQKLAHVRHIYHIGVDKWSPEGCVYIKCSDKRAAGEAYFALHGHYFDGRLVAVKYMRLPRYHERFPEATEAAIPLKP